MSGGQNNPNAMHELKTHEPAESAVRSIGIVVPPVCICAGCDWWEDRTLENSASLTGWCDLFKKYTHPTHGTKCTGHTPKERQKRQDQRKWLVERKKMKANPLTDDVKITVRKPESEATFAASGGSLATASVRTLLAEMMAALDAGESEKYWQLFEAVMKRHEELLAEVSGPENGESSDRESKARSGKDVTD